MKPEQTLGFQDISRFLTDLFDGDLARLSRHNPEDILVSDKPEGVID